MSYPVSEPERPLAFHTILRTYQKPRGHPHVQSCAAVTISIPLNLVQKCLGHAQLSTTAIYVDAVGAEEKSIDSRIW